jgi:phage terminase large subunit-like protein
MQAVTFFFLNHTRVAGKPFVLAPFQQFTIYNVFAWKKSSTGYRLTQLISALKERKNC